MIYLGVDSGTQSTKTIALELETGAVLATASAPHTMVAGLPPGHLEQHPQWWIEAAEQTIRDCVAQLGARRQEIRGIGVSGQQHGLVVLDKQDQVIRAAKLWCDTSTVSECRAFDEAFGGAYGLIKLAGNAILPGYTAPKLLWLKRHEPTNFARVRSVLLPHDYLNFWLTGEKRMEYGDASGTALLDVRSRQWSLPLCAFITEDLPAWLPLLGSSAEPAGILRQELCQAWGLPLGVIVSAGGGDNMMGAIGTGNVQEGVLTASLGTSGTIYGYAEHAVVDPQGEIAAFCDSTDHWLPLACTMNVTVATERIRQLFGWSLDKFNHAIDRAPVGCGGLRFLPYLNGERTPNLPNATGSFHGVTVDNLVPESMARAVVEGVTLGLAYGLERFTELGLTPREVRLTGGGSKSEPWRKIVTHVFGVQTVCLATSEGAALGGAIQAARCDAKSFESLAELTTRLVKLDEGTRLEPDMRNAAFYAHELATLKNLTVRLHAS